MRYQHPDLDQITTFLEGMLIVSQNLTIYYNLRYRLNHLDFGMTVAKKTEDQIWYRGYGEDQYVYYARQGHKKFLGGTFTVETYQDLEKYAVRTFLFMNEANKGFWARATKHPTAGEIQELADAPGGGFMVTLTDPEGFPVNLMFGQKAAEKGDFPQKLTVNYEDEKPRIRKFQRFQPGAAAVHKVRTSTKQTSSTVN